MKPTTNNLEGWVEDFDKRFLSDGEPKPYTSITKGRFLNTTHPAGIKHFISDLRKHDMEELINKFGNMAYLTKTIKDYYERLVIHKHSG